MDSEQYLLELMDLEEMDIGNEYSYRRLVDCLLGDGWLEAQGGVHPLETPWSNWW